MTVAIVTIAVAFWASCGVIAFRIMVDTWLWRFPTVTRSEVRTFQILSFLGPLAITSMMIIRFIDRPTNDEVVYRREERT